MVVDALKVEMRASTDVRDMIKVSSHRLSFGQMALTLVSTALPLSPSLGLIIIKNKFVNVEESEV